MGWRGLGVSLVAWLSLGACGARTGLDPGRVGAVDKSLRPPDTQPVVLQEVDKVDLLFVIDNSGSMADKQALLREAVPTLLERLINPPCISQDDRSDVLEVSGPEVVCPAGFQKDFEPLIDLHVGVVTSSLGGHGGDLCTAGSPGHFSETENDHAHLLGTLRRGLPTYDEHGFLAWDPAQIQTPPGVGNVPEFVQNFQSHVTGAGESGCGYEATQEAWYRFLVEPDPYLDVSTELAFAVPLGRDESLLAQRARFLRDDSLLMIVVLSDEDDCSIMDSGLGWLAAQASGAMGAFTMPAATSTCDADPNSVCCRSCGLVERAPPRGCASLSEDAGCKFARDPITDSHNLRCFQQKRRFGLDLLYPIERYVEALESLYISDTRNCNRDECPRVPNPLFTKKRDPSLVMYTAIVGVPWQDIATSASLTGPGLEYLSASQLTELDRWRLVLGEPQTGESPGDPLMIPSVNPRTGVHPLTLEAVAPATATDPLANSVNGHEQVNTDQSDLQYACIFPLAEPRDCSSTTEETWCDCSESDVPKNRPLCNPPGGGPAGLIQYYAKAYPGPRHLEIARELGDSASVASICPKVSEPPTSALAYGYNPAAEHMYQRLSGGLGERCLSEPLPHSSDGRAECVLWQLRAAPSGCDCTAMGLEAIDPEVLTSVEQTLSFECGFRSVDCGSLCACQLPQLSGRALEECQTSAVASNVEGWCSIDPGQGFGSPEFVSDCRTGQPRTLRLLGRLESLRQTDLFLTCPE